MNECKCADYSKIECTIFSLGFVLSVFKWAPLCPLVCYPQVHHECDYLFVSARPVCWGRPRRARQRIKKGSTTFRSSFVLITHLYFIMYPRPQESLQAEHSIHHYVNDIACMLCNLHLIYTVFNSYVFLKSWSLLTQEMYFVLFLKSQLH